MTIKSQHLLTCGAVILPLALAGCIVPADRYYYDDRGYRGYDHWGDPHRVEYYHEGPGYYREHYYEYNR